MQLLVRALASGRVYALDVQAEQTIASVKEDLAKHVDAEPRRQQLLCFGRKLADSLPIRDCSFVGTPSFIVAIKPAKIAAPVPSVEEVALPAQPQQPTAAVAQAPAPVPPPRSAVPMPMLPPDAAIPVEAFPVDPDALQLLLDMGFADHAARKALLLNVMNPEQAAEWLLLHSDDGQADGPLSGLQLQRLAALFHATDQPMPMPPPQGIVPDVQQAIDEGVCTYVVTGANFSNQQWLHCFTCGLIGDKGCCMACAKVCHAGHKLSPVKPTSSFFCDCGAGALPSCVCTAVTRKLGEHPVQAHGPHGDELTPPPAPSAAQQ